MKALLLAAGLGTRLRPLTDHTPKCMVPIHGKPLLQIWLERLAAAGVGSCLINTHHLADQVSAFVSSRSWSQKITLAHEAILLGTAGTLLKNLDFFQGEDGMLIHADNYCLADLQAFVESHRQRPMHCLMSMMTFRTDNPSSCGIVELDAQGVVVGFHEKVASPPGNLANAAIYLLSAEMMDMLHAHSGLTDMSTQVLHRFIGRIHTWETKELFLDIGTPENYKKANGIK